MYWNQSLRGYLASPPVAHATVSDFDGIFLSSKLLLSLSPRDKEDGDNRQ